MCRWDVDHVQVTYRVTFADNEECTLFISNLHGIVAKLYGTTSVAETGNGDEGDCNVRELMAVSGSERELRKGKCVRGHGLHV